MLTLIKNEFIKLFKRPKTIVLLILFFVAATGCTFIAHREAENWEKYNSIEYRIENEEASLNYTKEYLKDAEKELKTATDKETIVGLKENIRYYKEDIKNYESYIKELKKEKLNPKTWQEIEKENIKSTKNEIANIKKQIVELESIKGMKAEQKEQQKVELLNRISWMEDSVTLSQDALDKNIKPMMGPEFLAGNVIANFSMILSLAIPLFIAIFGSDIVSDEATNETFKFLLIQPVSRGKILMSKFITLITTMITMIMGTQMVIFLGAGFANGFEHLKLLTKVGIKYEYDMAALKEFGEKVVVQIPDSGYYITTGELITQIFIFQIVFIIAACALTFMISTICKSNMISMAISTVILVGGAILPMFIPQIGPASHLTFLGYNNPALVIMGEISQMYNNIHYNAQTGLVIMLVSTVVLLVIAHLNFNRKDILV